VDLAIPETLQALLLSFNGCSRKPRRGRGSALTRALKRSPIGAGPRSASTD